MILITAHLKELFCWWQCSDRFIISLSPHLHTPLSLFSPSLISLVVSVHHVYWLTTSFLLEEGCRKARLGVWLRVLLTGRFWLGSEPRADKCSTFKAWSRPKCSHAYFAYCEEFFHCPSFDLPGLFTFILFGSSPYLLTALVLNTRARKHHAVTRGHTHTRTHASTHWSSTPAQRCEEYLSRYPWRVPTEHKWVPKDVFLCIDTNNNKKKSSAWSREEPTMTTNGRQTTITTKTWSIIPASLHVGRKWPHRECLLQLPDFSLLDIQHARSSLQ